jgi:hypothetical protein
MRLSARSPESPAGYFELSDFFAVSNLPWAAGPVPAEMLK